MPMDLTDYDNVPSIKTNLGSVLKRWPEHKTIPITRKGIGPRRLRTRYLKGDCWGKKASMFGRFCSFYCAKGKCRGCAQTLQQGRCLECRDDQTVKWVKCPRLGCGQEGQTEWVDGPLYSEAKMGHPLIWPGCKAKTMCVYHTCNHVCDRRCDHKCTLECRVHRHVEDHPFGCTGCRCPSEWTE